MEGEVKDTLVRLVSESNGESFSFVGELEKSVAPSRASEAVSTVRCLGLPGLSRLGDSRLVPSEADGRMPTRWAVGGGVFAGDDFWGEMDLARSAGMDCQHFHPCSRSGLLQLSRCQSGLAKSSVSDFAGRNTQRAECSVGRVAVDLTMAGLEG
jgi:hypothetical protein